MMAEKPIASSARVLSCACGCGVESANEVESIVATEVNFPIKVMSDGEANWLHLFGGGVTAGRKRPFQAINSGVASSKFRV